ncbi:tetratricopeptide repeat protein [Streptomyces sp. NPDC001068]|uniref:tetratricopeptide repeat protein n=1 Tax=Streptomyces sp. NPDC001068 TaxID=3364544 RepID=UPI0036AACBD5
MTTEDVPDYYTEFGIDRSATADEVSEGLDRAVRTWSSRASRAPDAKKRREAEDKVELISQARRDLLDRTRRNAYNLRLDQARRRPRAPEPASEPPPQPTLGGRDWMGHARTLITQGNNEGALYELRQAVHHDDANGDAWRLLGTVHANQGHLQDALQELHRALALHPGDALTHTLIAKVHERRGDPVSAANWYVAASRLAPGNTDSRVAAANSFFQAGRFDEALSCYEEVLIQKPDTPVVRDQIGRIWSLRAEGAMVWHPTRQRYVIPSPASAAMVTHCVEQALAVGISDAGLVDCLNRYRTDAGRALARTWRWYRSMAAVMAVSLVLMVTGGPVELRLLAVAGFYFVPVAIGVKPRWRHAYNDLPPYLRSQTRRLS